MGFQQGIETGAQHKNRTSLQKKREIVIRTVKAVFQSLKVKLCKKNVRIK